MADEGDFDWDAEDFDPDAGFQKKDDDRWEGEDEGLEQEVVKEEVKPVLPVKAKKTKEGRIAENKAKRRLEEKGPQAGGEGLSPQDQQDEKLRLLQLQKDADLQVAKELFGVTDAHSSVESMTSEDFEKFEETIVNRLSQLETSPHYTLLLNKLVPRICAGLDVEDLRKLSHQLSMMAQEKQRAKAPKSKKKSKAILHGTGKGTKKADVFDLDGNYDDFGGEYGEYDDFM